MLLITKIPMGLLNKMHKYNKIVRYLFVGIIAYLTEITTLYILNHKIGLSSVNSVAISFWVGFFVAFILQKLITFTNHDKRGKTIANQLLKYSILVIFNYVFTLFIVSLLTDKLNVIVTRTLTIAIITCWNFIIYNKYIFYTKTQNETAKII